MKIAIDISQIVYGTGVSVYTKNLVKNLLLIDREDNYLLFAGTLRRQDEVKAYIKSLKNDSVTCKLLPIPPTLTNILWNKLHLLPIETFVGKVDVFHSSDWSQPPSKAFKVTTVHDLSPILYPENSNPIIVDAHKARLKWIKKEVDRIIVPSKSTAKDIISEGIEESRIRIIPEAVDQSITIATKDEIELVKSKYNIKGKYLLAVGVNHRKNTERVIEAFTQVKAETNTSLVIIGYPYSFVKASDKVIFTGHVSQNELKAFYSGAETLVYPSLYEGFGLPILEAFKCGTPVVTSNVGSMAEVGQMASVLVDPNNTTSIVKGILTAIKNKGVLVKKGQDYVTQFSWRKTAEMTLKVYNEANI